MARSEMARAIFAFEGTETGDLSFEEGEVIEVLDKSSDWWQGKTSDGREGYFPFNRVELIPNKLTNAKNQLLGSASDLLGSLKTRSNGEKIKRVSVEHLEFRKNRRSKAVFEVTLTLEDSTRVTSEKTAPEFRKLDFALQSLDEGYEYLHNLPPEWSDELPLSTAQARERADALNRYLANNTHGRELFDMLILVWARAKKADLRKQTPTLTKVILSANDSRAVVQKKVESALAMQYSNKKERDPLDFFENSGNTGNSNNRALGKLARVKFDWSSRDAMEVQLIKYEYISVLQERTKYEGWWYGQKANGQKGVFPYNYVQVLSSEDVKKMFVKGGKTKGPRSPENNMKPSKLNKYNTSASSFNTTTVTMTPTLMSKPTPKIKSPGTKNSVITTTGGSTGRDRRLEDNYVIRDIDAFDELKSRGVTIFLNNRLVKWKRNGNAKSPKSGELVSLTFNAYVWNPQTQQLIEFSSSEKLRPPPKDVPQGIAGDSGKNMEFIVGSGEVIDGLDEAISQLEPNGQKYRVTISPMKAFGDVGCPPEIPGNCFLVYDLVLIAVTEKGYIKPNRQAIFSVGINKAPNINNKAPRGSAREYKGFKSIKGSRSNESRNNRRNKNTNNSSNNNNNTAMAFGSNMNTNKRGVDTEAYKGKLTLKQLQDIVRKKSFEEFGVVANRIEDYLTEYEFRTAFNMDRKQYLMLPTFQKNQKRKELRLR